MNLVDAYTGEIGRRLPAKSRADIEAEIRSAVQDMLEEKSRTTGKPIDDEMTLEVLKTYGEPEKVAASYRGERFLIGPKLYPTFEKIVAIVLPIVVVLGLVSLGVELSRQDLFGMDIFSIIARTLGNIIWSSITTIGTIAFIFAVIERTVPEFKLKPREKEWDPRSLYKATPSDAIKAGSLITEIFFTALALVVFNFFPQLINTGYYSNGAWWVGFISTNPGAAFSTTWLSQQFFAYLPALDIIWGATIGLNIMVLSLGRWQKWSRWAFLGLKTLAVGLAVVMLAGPSLVGVTAASLTSAGFPDPSAAVVIVELLKQVVDLVLIFAIIFGGVDIIRAILRMLRPSPAAINQ